ncbi:MAG: hypothetical protein LIP23_09825, partial [Planctomycetes bacterium]|nr:hypothetical protein [Planctomycetota bacterium]
YPVVNIEAMQSNLNFDSAAHFIHLTSGPSLPAVVVAEPDAVGTAFFKGVYLLANRNMTFAEVVTAIEPDLASQPESRSQILHLLRRLDVDALRQTYGASQAVTEPEPAVEADDAGSVQTVAVEADDESGTSQTDDGTGLDNDVIPADSSPESPVDMVAGSGGSL